MNYTFSASNIFSMSMQGQNMAGGVYSVSDDEFTRKFTTSLGQSIPEAAQKEEKFIFKISEDTLKLFQNDTLKEAYVKKK